MKIAARMVGFLGIDFISGLIFAVFFSFAIGLLSAIAPTGTYTQLFLVVGGNAVVLLVALALLKRKFNSVCLLASFTAGYFYLWVFSRFAEVLFRVSIKGPVP